MNTMHCPHAVVDCATCENSKAAAELRGLREYVGHLSAANSEVSRLKRELEEARGQRSLARADRFERALINIALGDVSPQEEASLALRDVFAPLTSPPNGKERPEGP